MCHKVWQLHRWSNRCVGGILFDSDPRKVYSTKSQATNKKRDTKPQMKHISYTNPKIINKLNGQVRRGGGGVPEEMLGN